MNKHASRNAIAAILSITAAAMSAACAETFDWKSLMTVAQRISR